MAPAFQSSFIPKDPITPEIFKKKKAGVFGILAISLFICSIIVAVAIVVYKNIVKGDIVSLQSELIQAEKKIDKNSVKDMLQFSRKLDIVKSIISKHQVVSGFLSSLASSTVTTVTFTDFGYSALSPNGLTVTMKGKTNSYGSVALQEEIFMKNKYWKSVSFSNLSLGEKGAVVFDVAVAVDPQIVVYIPETQIATTTNKSIPVKSASSNDVSLDKVSDIDLEINNL